VRARLDAQPLAWSIGLRIEMLWYHSKRVYVLWPDDGFAWEIADPPVATTLGGITRILRLIYESNLMADIHALKHPQNEAPEPSRDLAIRDLEARAKRGGAVTISGEFALQLVQMLKGTG
jgi:hypothetical protein